MAKCLTNENGTPVCERGHLKAGLNAYRTKCGYLVCKQCRAAAQRTWVKRKRAGVADAGVISWETS